MDENTRASLIAAGINVDEVLERFMNNAGLLTRMLKKFCDDGTYAQLTEAVQQKDADAVLKASHTLKGVSGNLSLSKLHDLTTKQVELIRANDADSAFAMMPEITEAYDKAVNVIRTLE